LRYVGLVIVGVRPHLIEVRAQLRRGWVAREADLPALAGEPAVLVIAVPVAALAYPRAAAGVLAALVLAAGHGLEMTRPEASAPTADVVDLVLRRDGPNALGVDLAVNAPAVEGGVTVAVDRPRPEPAPEDRVFLYG
jgi:hypothetical protein